MKLTMINTCSRCGDVDEAVMYAIDRTSSRENNHKPYLCIPCHYKQTCPHGKTLVQTCKPCGDTANQVSNSRTLKAN